MQRCGGNISLSSKILGLVVSASAYVQSDVLKPASEV